jgi:hypothetical protein
MLLRSTPRSSRSSSACTEASVSGRVIASSRGYQRYRPGLRPDRSRQLEHFEALGLVEHRRLGAAAERRQRDRRGERHFGHRVGIERRKRLIEVDRQRLLDRCGGTGSMTSSPRFPPPFPLPRRLAQYRPERNASNGRPRSRVASKGGRGGASGCASARRSTGVGTASKSTSSVSPIVTLRPPISTNRANQLNKATAPPAPSATTARAVKPSGGSAAARMAGRPLSITSASSTGIGTASDAERHGTAEHDCDQGCDRQVHAFTGDATASPSWDSTLQDFGKQIDTGRH